MKYMLLIYGDQASWDAMSPEDQEPLLKDYFALDDTLKASGELVDGFALENPNAATTVRVRNDETLTTDGPFAETQEVLGGYYVVDCENLDRAIEVAAMIPDVRSGSVEVRPVMEFEEPGS